MTPAALLTAAKAIVGDFLPDTCSVKKPTPGSADGFGGESDTLPDVATGIKCLYEPSTPAQLQELGGAAIGTTRHTLFLKLDDVDLHGIGPGWQIVIAARGDKAALTFEDPRRLDESNEVLLTVSAKLKQG